MLVAAKVSQTGQIQRWINERNTHKDETGYKQEAQRTRAKLGTYQPGAKARQDEHCSENRKEDQPIQQKVTHNRGDQRPGVSGKEAESRREVITERAKVANLFRLGFQRSLRNCRELGFNPLDMTITPMNPRRKPSADIAAAGNCRQIIELFQKSCTRELL